MKRMEWVKRIDVAIAERDLLKHPFYRDWQQGTLDRPRLQLYAAQYYIHVEAFPAASPGACGSLEGRLARAGS